MKKSNTPREDHEIARLIELKFQISDLQAQNNDLEELCFRWMKVAHDLVEAITTHKCGDSIKEAVDAYNLLAKGKK